MSLTLVRFANNGFYTSIPNNHNRFPEWTWARTDILPRDYQLRLDGIPPSHASLHRRAIIFG